MNPPPLLLQLGALLLLLLLFLPVGASVRGRGSRGGRVGEKREGGSQHREW
jgi:hypothetical protein